ncbi:MAG: PRC-barrel domain containing protein, partial [Candidatus Altiarchaeales archaeon]|nr:PRC-barrel domain containing protein [Candidatus Altiarchaeales archaeon]
ISPEAVEEPDYNTKKIHVRLTKKQIEQSPPIEADKPVNRQWEQQFLPYYGWASYWLEMDGDPNLRSGHEVKGYKISASDGELGGVNDLIVDDVEWRIRYIVVDTSSWNPLSKKTLVSPGWITSVDEDNKKVLVDLSQEQVKEAPEYNPDEPVNRERETVLYDYYGKPHYWEQQ